MYSTGIQALDNMGAETVLRFQPPTPLTKPQLAKRRARTRSQSLPLFLGDAVGLTPALFTVLAPGSPQSMPGGRLLRSLLARHGLHLDDGAWINYPPWNQAEDMDEVLRAAGSSAVLVVGLEAWKMYHPGLTLKHVHGRGVVRHVGWGDVVLWPVYHPDSVLHDKGMMEGYDMDIYLFAQMVLEEDDGVSSVGDWLSDVCARCGADQSFTDQDGLGYCEEHWDDRERRGRGKPGEPGVRITGARKKAVKKGRNTDPNQPRLG
jgi:hypothetical protein